MEEMITYQAPVMMAETHYAFTTAPLEVHSSPDRGGIWTSNPGNSPNPRATVPQYMAVIVAGSVEKKRSTVFGNIKKVLVIKTKTGTDLHWNRRE
jgi:hypothetical protein